MARVPRFALVLALVLLAVGLSTPAQAQPSNPINHIVVIYLENHSFDNLYGHISTCEQHRQRRRGSDPSGQERRRVRDPAAADQ